MVFGGNFMRNALGLAGKGAWGSAPLLLSEYANLGLMMLYDMSDATRFLIDNGFANVFHKALIKSTFAGLWLWLSRFAPRTLTQQRAEYGAVTTVGTIPLDVADRAHGSTEVFGVGGKSLRKLTNRVSGMAGPIGTTDRTAVFNNGAPDFGLGGR